MPEIQRKLALMGYPGVGKSSLTQRFVSGNFPESYDTTIEDYHSKDHFSCCGATYSLSLIDTAGQNEYSLFPRSCSVDVDGYILVYAINSKASFDILTVIYDKILDNIGASSVPLVVVGNKLDLQHREREVPSEDLKEIGARWQCPVMEVSAFENRKVEEIFTRCLYEVELNKGNIKKKEPSPCSIS